jgi:L-asparaginase II
MTPVRKPEVPHADASDRDYPENPVLVRIWRGGAVESQHRGSWVVADAAGRVVEGAGSGPGPCS